MTQLPYLVVFSVASLAGTPCVSDMGTPTVIGSDVVPGRGALPIVMPEIKQLHAMLDHGDMV